MQAQEINKLKQRFAPVEKPEQPIEPDTTRLDLEQEYQEWLKNEPLKIAVPEMRFNHKAVPRFNLPNPLNTKNPEPTFHYDAEALKMPTGIYKLPAGLQLQTASSYRQVPGLAQSTTATFALQYHKNNFEISGGTTIGKYQNFRWNSNVAAFHIGGAYHINDRITIGLQGSFVPNVRNIGPTSIFAPTNSYGGYARIRVNSWLRLVSGVNRYYDPVLRKWKTGVFIAPEIDLHNLLHLKRNKRIRQRERLKQALQNY